MPVKPSRLEPTVVRGVQDDLRERRKESKKWYDRGAHDLADIKPGQLVKVQQLPPEKPIQWCIGRCIHRQTLRSYIVEIDGRLFRQDRQFIRPTSEMNPLSTSPTSNDIGDRLAAAESTLTRMEQQATEQDQDRTAPPPKFNNDISVLGEDNVALQDKLQVPASEMLRMPVVRTGITRKPARYSDENFTT